MRTFGVMLVTLLTMGMVAFDAEARRIGGGKNIGKQREAISQQQAAPKAPAQQQAAPTTTTTPAQQPAGASKWLGPLAGLALGAGLAALFLNNGLAGVLAGLLMIAAVIAVAVFAVRLLRAKGAPAPLQYAGANPTGGTQPAGTPFLGGGAAPHSVAAAAGRWPADFDADEFVRHAKLNFVRMQEVHDQKDLAMMREVLTPEMYQVIEADLRAAGDAPQKTEVVTLNAEVLDVATEGRSYVVSVRFSGLIRETAGDAAQEFSEIWHLEKPLSGRGGWIVAGIQQG